jgi:hypothetical protein
MMPDARKAMLLLLLLQPLQQRQRQRVLADRWRSMQRRQ